MLYLYRIGMIFWPEGTFLLYYIHCGITAKMPLAFTLSSACHVPKNKPVWLSVYYYTLDTHRSLIVVGTPSAYNSEHV